MTGPGYESLTLLCIGLIVLIRIYSLLRYAWNLPLRNGPGFFFGIEVPPGFCDGPQASWLRRYHRVLLAEHAIEGCILAALLALAKWRYVPMWAGGGAVLFVGSMFLFLVWTRRALGAASAIHPVALALKTRRLGDYISWPLETLAAALAAFSWWLLLRHGSPRVNLLDPLQMTWIALGLLPGKIAAIRASWPLPVERTEDHYEYQDVARRNGVRTMDAFGWFFVIILFGYALRHGGPSTSSFPWLPWLTAAAALAVMGYLLTTVFQGQRQMARMGRGLRPGGSWATLFRAASATNRPVLIWFAVWFGVILVFIAYALL